MATQQTTGTTLWEKQVDQFVIDLKRRHTIGSFNAAKHTAELLRTIVSSAKWYTAASLMDILVSVGKRLASAQPLEFTTGNIVRRVLHIVREEYLTLRKTQQMNKIAALQRESDFGKAASPNSLSAAARLANSANLSASARLDRTPSMYSVLGEEQNENFTESIRELKASVIEVINELLEEIKSLHKNVADQAIEHIHSNEVIMTFGRSRTVFEFLKAAARKRKFDVIVAESGPALDGHQQAVELSEAGISTTLITDASIFAMMARVNKVIIPTHAVMANGGLVAPTGTHMLAVAAKHHSVPLMVCTGLYKLCPLYPYDQDTFNDFFAPSAIIRFEEANEISDVQIDCPVFDYIPPELVHLFVTNIGGHNPSYVYRLLVEYYNPEDTLEDDD